MAARTLDLFCGAGGSSWGARQAGAEIVGGVDMWPLAVQTYQDNFGAKRGLEAQLDAASSYEVARDIGDIDLLLASPECTNHTCARGSRERDEDSQLTAMHVLNFVSRFRPRWTVIENVIQMRSWSRYGDLLESLEEIYGQEGISAQVLDAANFGVPQTRRRLFIFCDREASPPRLDRRTWTTVPTVQSILDPPGTWPRGPLLSDRRAAGTLERAKRGIATLGEGRPFLVVYYGSDGAGGWQPLDRPLRTMTTLDRFGLVEWDAGEPTLRMLQVPELRRAMGFDDGFRLRHGTRREQIKLLGNGVCPPVMRAIVSALTSADANSKLKLVA